ncbi:hypothetical protein [Amycolatopsis sp. NPDC051716]|uniref:hypothetical protein n=1 Tax=Amycolatopsis sp. NPDC051716 TaxID=3155804 RepID=UPI00344AB922
MATGGASLLTATLGVLLVITHDYRSTPPFIVGAATAVAIAWIWRMLLAYREADYRADEELIEALSRKVTPEQALAARNEAAFREITQHLSKEA